MSANTMNQPQEVLMLSAYSKREELANAISHGLGILLGILGMIASVIKGAHTLNGVQLFGVVVYNASIITLFLCSTLYHSIPSAKWRPRLKLADHCAIYLLIAGTYTPLMLISLHTIQADIVLAAIWSLAIAGVVFKVRFIHKFKALSVGIYLLMGWLCVTVMSQLTAGLSEVGFNLLLAGGLFYSVGVIFYVVKAIPFNHAIWHLFVLMGAFSHWLCVYLAVIPAR
ncbi:hemolysin III family protein [Shewanella corallii]|uniref:Hemolysin III family protein n=1 Tax=Shewanella corallii TaxID=560080 RepID=A0ABT0N9R9_9GAMM|nr:hemolysin III family protein [Shewanella corallii]MCL2914885.1 hemolysin III family protein [Shewanella corallii]